MKLALATQALAAAVLAAGVALTPVVSHAQSTPQQAAQKSERHRLVLQVSENDPANWNLALNNAENVQQALGKDNVQVEIVAYGPGLNMLKGESKVAGRLNAALDNNVSLLACGTTMRKMKLTKADLAGGVNVVPGGVVHIMQRQSEGWNYVKP
jgi:intracellular sulfur oxidation DsrE/DsrF family protein